VVQIANIPAWHNLGWLSRGVYLVPDIEPLAKLGNFVCKPPFNVGAQSATDHLSLTHRAEWKRSEVIVNALYHQYKLAYSAYAHSAPRLSAVRSIYGAV